MSLKFVIPIIFACVFIVGGIAYGVNFALNRTFGTGADQGANQTVASADIDVDRMLAIIREESLQRMEGTPLKALTMLADPLQDGSITVDFTYMDPFFDLDVSGMLSLYSNLDDANFALIGEVLVPFMGNFDLSVFLNEERIAMQSSIIDNYFYGIRFNTFEQDFQTFVSATDLDPFIVEEVMTFLAGIDYTLAPAHITRADFDYLAPYFEPFVELYRVYIDSYEITRTNVTVVGEHNVDAVRYSYTATFEMSLQYLEDYTDLLENLDVEGLVRETFYVFSEQIEAQTEEVPGEITIDQIINITAWGVSQFQSEMVRELRSNIEDLRQQQRDGWYPPNTTNIYIDNNGRLLRMFYIEEGGSEMTLDFGTSIYDPWFFEITTFENWVSYPVDFRLDWKFESEDDLTVNRISADSRGVDGVGSVAVVSEWNTSTGDFIKWIETGGRRLGSMEGTFIVQDGGFELGFTDIDIDGALLSFTISTAIGANIPQIDFINMDRWDAALVNRVEEAIYSFRMIASMF